VPRPGKVGSKAERDTLRQEMLVGGCSLEMIATEMERRWGFRPREAYRHAHGWSQDEVAARFTEVADRLGAERGAGPDGRPAPQAPMIGTRIGEYERWPNGGRRPSPYVLTVLATVLGTSLERLLDYDDHRKMPDQERTVLAAVFAAATPPLTAQAPPAAPVERMPLGRLTQLATAKDRRSPALPFTPDEPDGTDPARPDAQPTPRDRTAGGTAPEPERVDRPDPTTLPEWVAPPGDPLQIQGRLPQRVPRPVPPPISEQSYIAVAIDPVNPDAAVAARRSRRDRTLVTMADALRPDEEAIMDAAGQSAEFGEWAEGTNVGATTLEQLDEDVRRISRDYLSNPPLPLMLSTLRVRNRVFTLLEGRQHPGQTRHLYLTAGRLCGLLAWMASDVGRHAEAETQARTAWLCAELAGADGLRAWVRATQSKVAYWDGRVRESAALAGDGLRFAASDSARVLLASLSARAWARVGDPDQAHAALRAAEDERAKAGPDEVGGLLGFSEAQQSYMAGSTHLWLREPKEALAASDRAVWLFDVGNQAERFYGAEMLALMDAATALVQSGDLDGALERLRPVLDLPPEQQLDTFTSRLSELRDALRRSKYAMSRPAVDIQRQIEEFRTGALGQILSR
jgi:transcriptional regulator with XRE-family HTH domain/tetratricopeptide (TPR) repeat protein